MLMTNIHLYKNDLPGHVVFKNSVAIDSETMGLQPHRDRLCLLQLSGGDGVAHLVQFEQGNYDAPNLKRMLADPAIEKIFHFARFDLQIIQHYLGVTCAPVYCTKMASRLCRTYTDRHGLRNLVQDLLGVELNKEKQSSDWGADKLSDEQMAYAANDVLYLHRLRVILDQMIVREGREDILRQVNGFLNTRAALDLIGWSESDIFAHAG